MEFGTLIEATEYFSSKENCINYLTQIRWSNGVTCTYCEHTKVYKLSEKYKRYKCAKCLKQFSATVNTIFHNSPIPLQKWFVAIYLMTSQKKGISSVQLSKHVGVTQKTAWFVEQRIRYALKIKSFTQQLDGIIQVDETFVGGKNKNRHANKKVPNSQGRSFKDKTPILGVLQTEISHIIERPHKLQPHKMVKEKVISRPPFIHCQVMVDTKKESIQPIIYKIVKIGSTIFSDEWSAYKGLENDYNHQFVDHGKGQYVNKSGCTTNAVECAWSQFKRTIIGTHHQVSRKHLQRYTDEFMYRYNRRKLSDSERFDQSAKRIECRLTYKELIKKVA